METGNYKETGANLATALQLIQKLAVNPAIGKATPAEIVNELYKELLELCEEQIPDSTKHKRFIGTRRGAVRMAYLAVADGTGHRLGWTNKKGEYHGSPGDGLTPVIFASRKYRFGENNVAGEFLDGMPIFAEDSLWPATYREINDAYRIQCLNADKEIAVKTDSNGHTHALIMGIAKKSKGADDRAAGDSVKANIALLEKIADWMAEDSAANLHIASPEELAEIAGSIAKIEVAMKTAQKITNGIVE